MAIDVEALISLVFSRKPLWDQQMKLYKNKVIADKLWRQISTELGNDVTTDEAKKKWKSLRNLFGKELKKVPVGRSGDEAPLNFETYTTWPHFESMLFLKDQMRPRKSGGNLQPNDVDNSRNSDTQESAIQQAREQNEVVELQDAPEIDHTDENDDRPQRRPHKRGIQQQLIDIEAKKLKLLENKVRKGTSGDDEDEAFFKSLLPHVRKMQPEKKLVFRVQVQNLVQKFVYQKNRLLNDPNQNLDDSRASSSANNGTFQHSTPFRRTNELFDTGLRTPLRSDVPQYYDTPNIRHHVEEAGTVQEIEPADTSAQRSTIITSSRQYYTVITSPISSVLTQL